MLIKRLGERHHLGPTEIAVALLLRISAHAGGRIVGQPFPTDRKVEGCAKHLDRAVGAHRRAADRRDVTVKRVDFVMGDGGDLHLAEAWQDDLLPHAALVCPRAGGLA